PHSIRNTGSEILRCIVVGERLPHDVCDYPRQNKRMFRNLAMPSNLVDLSEIQELGGSVGKK
ncbi:MAG TPA: cupin, partial [Trinickia sp.]